MLRWIVRALAALAALIVLVPAGLMLWLKLSQPATSGEVRLQALTAPVELSWDANAVPHIFAPSLRDAYRVLGWVHARDRLWQMETQRRIGQGRLAEIVGSAGLGFDRQMRTLGLYRLAEASYGQLDADTRADIDAYAEGVNAFLARPAAALPIEFQLLHVTPEPWKPADTLVWGRLMALQLSGNFREEAARAQLIARVPEAVYRDLFPETPRPGPTTLGALDGIDWSRFAANLPEPLGPSHASNEWVVDGALTQSGKPLLANDPHLGLSAPILWYLARIVTPEGSLSGVTFPGVPFHMLGHNDRIAWGLTTTGGDVQDLFVEDIDPQDPTQYLTPTGGARFQTRDEIIKVRFGADVHLTVRETRHGPVLSDSDPELAAAAGKNKVVALSFIGLMPNDTTVSAVRGMNRAHDWASFQAALKLWRSPEQNVVYADVDGHIGYTAVGALPLRRKPTDDLPARGANGEADWIGLTEFSQLPQGADPSTHRFINANNQVAPADFPVYVGRRYELPFRAERIAEMLNAGKGFTADDFARMQLDTKEQDAVLLLPRLLAAKPRTPEGQQALALLRAWDMAMAADRPEPLIYTAWVYRLQRALLEKRLGAEISTQTPMGFDPFLIVRLLDGLAEGDDQTILASSLDDIIAALAKPYGADMKAWKWGTAHPAALQSQLLGAVPVLGGLFDASLPAPGGPETVNRAAIGRHSDVLFPDGHGPGYRGVFDLANLDATRFIIATGQSGNPLSPHFDDITQRWRDGSYLTLSGTADQVASGGLGRMHFAP